MMLQQVATCFRKLDLIKVQRLFICLSAAHFSLIYADSGTSQRASVVRLGLPFRRLHTFTTLSPVNVEIRCPLQHVTR